MTTAERTDLYRPLWKDWGDQLNVVRDELLAGGQVCERSAYIYLGALDVAAGWCREQGTTLADVSGAAIERYLGACKPDRAKQTRTALRHFWRITGRPDPPVWALSEERQLRLRLIQGRTEPYERRDKTPKPPRWAAAAGTPAYDAMEAFVDGLRRAEVSPKTQRAYTGAVWRLERWCAMRGTTVADVDPDTLAGYVAVLPATWSTRKQLRTALAHYWRITGRADPPVWVIRVPPKPRRTPRGLSEKDANALARHARAQHDKRGLATVLALYNGLRVSEIAALRWAGIGADGWLTLIGKGDVEATIPLHEVVLQALGDVPRVAEHVFPGDRGRAHVTSATVWGWIRDLAAEVGVNAAPHRLRHTCLTAANDATGDLRAVQELARHASPDTTAIYTRASERRLLSAVSAIAYDAADPDRPPEPNPVPYRMVLTALGEWPHGVDMWCDVALLLQRRAGWRFGISDDGHQTPSWQCRDLLVDVMALRNQPAMVDLVRFHDDTGDEFTAWRFHSVAEFEAVLPAFEAGEELPAVPWWSSSNPPDVVEAGG